VPITSEETLAIFQDTGAYLHGHFLLTSGLHSPEYLQCALVLQHPTIAERLGRELANSLRPMIHEAPSLIVAPAMGGLIIGHEVARAFGVPFVFTERDATRDMQLRRGFAIPPGSKAIVIEDVITTGGSTREVIDVLTKLGCTTLAAGSIMDRSGGVADVGVSRAALATLSVQTFNADNCPMCAQGTPAVKPGSRPLG